MTKEKNNLSFFIKNLLKETKKTSDNECMVLNQKAEIEYIQMQKKRISYTIEYIDFIVKNNLPNKKIKLLDIGTTPFTFLYKEYFNIEVSTIDKTKLLSNRCKLRDINFKKCDLMKEIIPFNNKEFDICIFTEVFEHLVVRPATIFKEIHKILKDEGFLIFSTPNIATLFNRIKFLLGKPVLESLDKVFQEDHGDEWPHGIGHLREYTMSELVNLLKKYQFNIIKSNHIGNVDFIQDKKLNYLLYFYSLIQKMIPQFRHFNLILAQKRD